MDQFNSESAVNKVKTRQDLSDVELVTEDIKSKLTIPCNECLDKPQTNGVHQFNGSCDDAAESVNIGHESKHNDTSQTKRSDHTDGISESNSGNDIEYVSYTSELQMPDIMKLIQKDLSEPYSIYTYRYFIHNWPKLCFLAMDGEECIGAIVCKLDIHRKVTKRGYIAMLAVDIKYRKRKIGSNLVRRAIQAMIEDDADEVVLETEITNHPALRLYENLGFVRDKRLFRYYLNGVDALRLKLWLR
ncbi:hypothetical protein QAD02_021986 [Eretmocerus hayati]|uniref:Uncharacterized protein n=1 Tax=Eretmocerus hayati TaxID=131215 RepID=A0ACC2PS12_9HYME|nr:hypothetical protein QAD02_021986 [Eretmocerus hayati]